MKKFSIIIVGFLIAGTALVACKDAFLDEPPRGVFSEGQLANRAGVEGILIGAYSLLDGVGGPEGGWAAAASNWVFGNVASDDAYKGTDAGDQAQINPIERYEALPNNSFFNQNWRHQYDGVARSNDVLRLVPQATDLTEAQRTRIMAEARFLRGHYHFQAKRMFNKVPYIDESTIDLSDFSTAKVPNTAEIWPEIEADFKFAYDNLPETQPQVGRANKWAAGAFLAKAYMYQRKFSEARPLLETIIANGQTAGGKKYALNPQYHTNFRVSGNNSAESVFAVQNSVNDGGGGLNAAYGDILNFTYSGGPGGCCGFHQPTQNLVNAHKTTAAGLPPLDLYVNGTVMLGPEVISDQGLLSTAPFTPYQGPLDPRLDWSVGRRGIPYLDWGPHPGAAWIRDQAYAGPYSPKKTAYYKAEERTNTDITNWTSGLTAINTNLMRFADVLLMAAEAEVEVGTLERARELVNMVRTRAANPEGFVKKADGTLAANYVIGAYPTPWTNKDMARTAVQLERRIELAMEGHRFFDLVRYGRAAETLTAYLIGEQVRRQYLQGATFRKGVNEYFPIPEQQIVLSSIDGKPTLTQNPGF